LQNLKALLGASAPLDASDELDVAIDRVIGDQALSVLVGAGQRHLRLDVERKIGATRRPDRGCERDIVLDGIVVVEGAFEVGFSCNLGRLAREVICCALGSCDVLVEGCKATIDGLQDGILEALRVVKIKVELTELAGVRRRSIWPNLCNVVVEDEGEGLAII